MSTDEISGKAGRRPFERHKTFAQLEKERELDAPYEGPDAQIKPVKAVETTRALVKKEAPLVKAADDSDVFDLSLLDDPKFIESATRDADQPQWRHLVTAANNVKIVHKPNNSQKAFEISITDQSGNTKELLVFVKRHNKDPFNKNGDDTVEDNFDKCLVTFAGTPDQSKMAKHLQESINAALSEDAGRGEYFTPKETSERHETEIARYGVARPYRETEAAARKALEAYVAALNSHGLVSAVLKDDVVIHAERKSQLDRDSLADLVTDAFVFDPAVLSAANNLQTTAQFPVKIEPLTDLHAINGVGSVKDTVGAATREKIRILEAVNAILTEEIPERITTAIMAEVNRTRPVIGVRPISESKVEDIVFTAVNTAIDPDQYAPPARGYIEKVTQSLSESLTTYINNGITEGKAFPKEAKQSLNLF